MSAATETIAYDGDALRDGSMDVRDLAPALLELGALCERVNELLNGDQVRLKVNVRADFKKGSFAVNLEVIQTAYESVRQLLFGQGIQDAKYIWEVISGAAGAGGGILFLYKKLRGKAARQVEEKGAQAEITINNTTVIVPVQVVNTYNDEAVRSRVEGVMRPLLREGIDVFEARSGEAVIEEVTKEEAEAAAEERRSPDIDIEPPMLESTHEAALEIVKVPFRSGLVWNFAMGKTKLSAEMKDEDFLRRHQSGETAFSAGDVLLVMLHTQTWHTGSGLRVHHEVTKVINHVHRTPQGRQRTIAEM